MENKRKSYMFLGALGAMAGYSMLMKRRSHSRSPLNRAMHYISKSTNMF